MPRSPLTEIVGRLNLLAEQINALSADERNYLLDLLLPPEAPVKTRRKRKKAATTSSRRGLPDHSMTICGKEGCGTTAVNAIHDEKAGYAGYHPFVAPTTAPPATRRSSRNGQKQEQAASSVTKTAGVGDAQVASVGGD